MMRHRRGGFSLMEVMLATAILLGSSIILAELATIGRKQADSAYDLNTAQLLCQALLDEIVAGVVTAKPVEDQEFEDNPGWFYSVEAQPIRKNHLIAVKVSVFQEPQESKRSVRFSLVRWLPDRSRNPLNESSNQNSAVSQRQESTQEVRP